MVSDEKPKRIQRKRTAGWRMPEDAVVISRPSRWGNPFRALPLNGEWIVLQVLPDGYKTLDWFDTGEEAIADALARYEARVLAILDKDPSFLEPLRGKTLCCWCAEDKPCHADVLLLLLGIEGGAAP